MKCKICNHETKSILNLGETPLANRLLDNQDEECEKFRLDLHCCIQCRNLQLSEFVSADVLYKNYLYVTPNSSTLETHYDFLIDYLLSRNTLGKNKSVVEIGCNAGQFLKKLNDVCFSAIGVDPAENIVQAAKDHGLNVVNNFFNISVALDIKKEFGPVDAVIARHCFAHNEFPHDMLKAASELLVDEGAIVIENAYVLNTVLNTEFDQVYHEHMYYYSIASLNALLDQYGFEIVDATIGSVHGGSIIAIAKRKGVSERSKNLLIFEELEAIQLSDECLEYFSKRCCKNIENIQRLLTKIHTSGKTIYSYGATAKGNTLMNSMNITCDIISACVDSTNIKQGKFLPGSKIPIVSEEEAFINPPDFYFLTAWNYKDEIIKKVRTMGNYNTRFIIPFPNVHIN